MRRRSITALVPRADFAPSKDAAMSRLWALSLIACVMGLSSGCAMCCAPFDYAYQNVTGRWARNNPSSGRVGSVFDEAGSPAGVITTSAEPTPAQPGTAAPSRGVPTTRSVIPRNMGENYLQPTP